MQEYYDCSIKSWIVPSTEHWDYINENFITIPEYKLRIEHSLLAISKWEKKYHKPFLETDSLTKEETIYYIKCMALDPLPDKFHLSLTSEINNEISEYLNDPATATVIKTPSGNKTEFLTSELLYYYMATLQIPIECETWNIHRLLTLIKIFNAKSGPQKKKSMSEIYAENKRINEHNRARFNSKG